MYLSTFCLGRGRMHACAIFVFDATALVSGAKGSDNNAY